MPGGVLPEIRVSLLQRITGLEGAESFRPLRTEEGKRFMSLFISGDLTPEHSWGEAFSGSACRHCCHRKNCPYSRERIYEKALRYAADQGDATARLLKEEAARVLASISAADHTAGLLRADQALEQALTDALCAELHQIKRISGR